MAKKEMLISPAGRAIYPKLTEPDTKFKKEGEYSVKLLMTQAEAAPILAACEELRQQAVEEEFEKQQAEKPKMKPAKIREGIKLADLPIKPYEDPETGEETGDYQATFKMTASGVSKKTGKPWTRRPAIFDAHNNPIDPTKIQIWSGSVLKAAYSTSTFSTAAAGTGVSLRLEAVQVIELVSGGRRDAAGYGFGAQEDGYSHEDIEDTGTPLPSGGGSGDDADADNGEADF